LDLFDLFDLFDLDDIVELKILVELDNIVELFDLTSFFAETGCFFIVDELELEVKEVGKLILLVFSVRIVLIVLAVFSVLKSFFLIRLLSNVENLKIRISEHKTTVTIIALYVKKCKSIPIMPKNLFIYLTIPYPKLFNISLSNILVLIPNIYILAL